MSTAVISEPVEKAEQVETRQILIFLLNDQQYGVDLLQVQEIRALTPITPVPNLPAHLKGVMNLRGAVLPVVDLRAKFGMPPAEYTKITVIIIAHSAGKSVGLVVDSISDVMRVCADNIQPAPDFGDSVDIRMVEGLLKAADRFAVLLDLEKLMCDGEPGTQTQA